jgi:fucose permease
VTSRRAQASTIFLSSFVQGLVGSAFPASAAVLRGRGLTDPEYGSIFVPQMALAALGAAGTGLVAHRIGAKRTLALGFLLMALSQAALAAVLVAPRGWVFAVAVVGTSLLGLGAGVSAGPLNAYPQVLFPARSESAVVALHTAVAVGLAVSPALAGAALERGAWLVLPLAVLAANLALLLAVESQDLPEPEPRPPGERVPRPIRAGALWLFLGVAFAYGVTESVYANWAVVFLTEERGLGLAVAGLALAAFWLALTAGRFLVAGLVLRLPPAPVLPVLAGLMGAACLLVPLATTPQRALFVYVLGGLGCSAVFPLALGLAGRRFSDHRSWVSSALFIALVSGLAAGSLSTGLLRPALDLASVYRLAAVPAAVAVALAVRAARDASRGAARLARESQTRPNDGNGPK